MLNSEIVGPVLKFLDRNFYRSDKKISHVLDLGAGEGWLAYWLAVMLRVSERKNEKCTITAIELYEPFLSSLQNKEYTTVIHADIITYYQKIQNYDLIIGLEVIEHINRIQIIEILKYIIAHNKYVFFSTPNGWREGGEYHNNPYQEHLSYFTTADAKMLNLKVKKYKNQLYFYSQSLSWNTSKIIRLRRLLLPTRFRTYMLKLFNLM